MDWIQKILEDKEQCEALSSFLRQYDVPDLGRALQLYREMHQVYMCRTKHSISKINIYDIYYLEIQGHDIKVCTRQGTFFKYGSLAGELKVLEPYGFLKCTKNCIVSLERIRTIQDNDIILENDVRIHMSRKYTREVIIAYSQIRLKS